MGTLAAGIKEIFATAKTTGSNVMLCGNDGTPDGHMTMANLASVLGDNNYIVLAAGTDFNDIEYNGVCLLNGLTFVNAPQSGEMRGLMFATKHEPARSQIVVTCYPNCIMYKRSYWNGYWQNWEMVYDTSLLTNSTMLGQLANAIGGLMFIGNREDANVIGTYFSTTASINNKHFPADGSYWTLISIGDTSIALCFQIAFSPNGDIFFRTYWNGWKSWRAFA